MNNTIDPINNKFFNLLIVSDTKGSTKNKYIKIN